MNPALITSSWALIWLTAELSIWDAIGLLMVPCSLIVSLVLVDLSFSPNDNSDDLSWVLGNCVECSLLSTADSCLVTWGDDIPIDTMAWSDNIIPSSCSWVGVIRIWLLYRELLLDLMFCGMAFGSVMMAGLFSSDWLPNLATIPLGLLRGITGISLNGCDFTMVVVDDGLLVVCILVNDIPSYVELTERASGLIEVLGSWFVVRPFWLFVTSLSDSSLKGVQCLRTSFEPWSPGTNPLMCRPITVLTIHTVRC